MSATERWWETFFSGLAVDCWLQAMQEAATKAELDFIEAMLQAPAGGKILDVPCGGGRHSILLAERGYQVTGVDLSEAFLQEARKKTGDGSKQVTWEQREMRDLPWQAEFDGAFCFGNSFGYLDDEGNGSFLQAVARVLKPGARFVLDAPSVLEVLLPIFQERAWTQVGDILFLAERRYDHVQGRTQSDYTFIRGGTIEKRTAFYRNYSFRALAELLAAAGFAELQGFGSTDREPFRFGSKRLFLVATKK